MIFVECRLPNGTKEYFVGTDWASLQAVTLRMATPSYDSVRVVEREVVEQHKLALFDAGVLSVENGRSKTYLLGAIVAPEETANTQ